MARPEGRAFAAWFLTLVVCCAAANCAGASADTCSAASPAAGPAAPTCPSGAASATTCADDTGPNLHVEDGFVSEDVREGLIKYLDSHEPDNPLGVIMAPAPARLARALHDALARLGARSAAPGRFPELSLAAFAAGRGRLPGKALTGGGSKDCHSDYEVDSGFEIDNVVGPTSGRVGIIYLSGEGEFLLRDETTGAETRRAIKPGRMMSWANAGNRHCVASAGRGPRRFVGPVVLDATASSFVPVVDILSPTPRDPCNKTSQCPKANPQCLGGACCTPAGSAATPHSFCCPGAVPYSPAGRCCYATGASAAQASQCCSRRLVAGVCAPPGDLSCVASCKAGAAPAYARDAAACDKKKGSAVWACKLSAAAQQSHHKSYCYAANLHLRC